jgi:hypothetical protein
MFTLPVLKAQVTFAFHHGHLRRNAIEACYKQPRRPDDANRIIRAV